MPYIKITVRDKVATGDDSRIVCGNSDYSILFDFDEEWDAYDVKTARFVYAGMNGKYIDVVLSGTTCKVPVLQDAIGVYVGVYAGDLHTTTPAWFECDKSILCGGGSPAAPSDDVYNQIMERLNNIGTPDAEAIAAAVADYIAENPIEEKDPTVPAWSKNETKPSYTAAEVGADPSGTAAAQVSAHNTGTDTHSDIRLLIQGLTDRLNALADSDDNTLDQLSEIVSYIKSNRDLIAAITTDKVSVADIVDNLTTNVANKPLSAAQGVALKALIDAIDVIETEQNDLNITWQFTDGMPEDKGLTYTGTEGKAAMQSDGLLLSAGAEYKPPVLTAGKASVECVFSSPNFGDYYGFRLQLTNGTTGIRISCYDNALIYNQHTDNNLTLAKLTTDTQYTLRIAWDEESGADVYLNGESVLTGGKTSYALAENLVSQVSGGGAILLKSLTYTFPGMGDEIVSINGKGLRDETARKMAMQGGGAGGLTVTNTAAVGQTIRVSAVDENGQPTEWEAVDMASGGGEKIVAEETVLASGTIASGTSANTRTSTGITCGEVRKWKYWTVEVKSAGQSTYWSVYGGYKVARLQHSNIKFQFEWIDTAKTIVRVFYSAGTGYEYGTDDIAVGLLGVTNSSLPVAHKQGQYGLINSTDSEVLKIENYNELTVDALWRVKGILKYGS